MSTSEETKRLAQKKKATRTQVMKKYTAHGLFISTGSLSTPAMSVPYHMMSCQSSPVDMMKIATALCPMLLKWMGAFSHSPPFSRHVARVPPTLGTEHR